MSIEEDRGDSRPIFFGGCSALWGYNEPRAYWPLQELRLLSRLQVETDEARRKLPIIADQAEEGGGAVAAERDPSIRPARVKGSRYGTRGHVNDGDV